ncbi:MAG: AraC family transcriptional regulator [Lachnospiraceae bacterium]|nr:AraC family transcriptional regulator [Lachnospiraceae bacterium]
MSNFSDVLLLSRKMEYERVHRELNEVLKDEFVINAKMQGELDCGKFIFPAVDVVKTDKHVLTRQQAYFSAKINIWESALYFHRHNFVELLYMYKGRCQQFIENLNHMVTLEEGDVFLLNQNVVHGLLQKDKEAVLIKLIIPADLISHEFVQGLDKNSEMADFWIGARSRRNENYHYLHYSGCAGEEKQFIEKLMTEYYLNQQYDEIAIRSYLQLLLIWVERENRKCNSCKFKMPQDSLDMGKITEYIYENSASVTLEKLADAFSYNSSYLSRMIRERCQISFQELVKECRLEKAIMLLVSTEDTVEEIAHMAGYRNSTPIYKGIRQKFGMSPTEYRNGRYK